MTPVLHVKNLTISREGTPILCGLDWAVQKGEHWVILGPNGSGKTSLLSALTGYLTPTGGSVSLLGETFGESDWRKLRERVGIVSSAVRQKVPDWDPAELVVIGGKYAMLDYWGPVRKLDKLRARELMTLTECDHLIRREWGVLSQGERQRVLIARALMASPDVLILDEPCAGLDPVSREKFLAFLQRLIATNSAPSLLFVTHHVEEIIPSLTHALLLNKGRILAAGEKGTVLTSRNLSAAFDAPITVRHSGGQWAMKIRRVPDSRA
jgi:iron complex transport system ATP-binding protein